MNKSILMTFALLAILSACSNNGNKAETKEAQKVEVTENAQTNSFTKIANGSQINWRASHLGGLQKRFGKVNLKSADVKVNDGKVSNATILIDMNTLIVESFPAGAPQGPKLTGHLKSPDFFNTATYPTAKFELTKTAPAEGAFNTTVTGNLTIMDITKSITFKANINVAPDKVSIKSEDFAVDRKDWGLTYHTEGTPDVPKDYLIADDLGFTINVTLSK